jgi:CBS domain-containing protein
MGKKARDIMTASAECLDEKDSVLDASSKLAKLNVGSMSICGEDNRLKGMLADRDIVVKVLAEGQDPSTAGIYTPDKGTIVLTDVSSPPSGSHGDRRLVQMIFRTHDRL